MQYYLAAYVTNAIGIHPIFGAFLTGVILPRKPTFIAQVRSVDQVNNLLFLPLFFIYSGLRTQIGSIHAPVVLLIGLLVLVVACLGKILGGAFSARLIGETWKESFSLGILMNTRGLVELIVLNIGLDTGVLSPTFFTILVIVALITTMMASPLLYILARLYPFEAETAGLPAWQYMIVQEFFQYHAEKTTCKNSRRPERLAYSLVPRIKQMDKV